MPPYLSYYFASHTKYQIHAPFVYEFLTQIFEDDRFYHAMGVIENYRRNLLGNGSQIITKTGVTTTNQLVKTLAISPKAGAILFKSVHFYKPTTLLEIGNSLGISTLYQATPNSQVPMITLMPDTSLATATHNYFKQLGTRNISILTGPIQANLSTAIQQLKTIDYLFLNGFWGIINTFNYFETCLEQMPSNAVFVFKSPYASKATQEFWEKAKKHQKVRLSIDIYDLGFLFFRSEQKQVAHYQIIESWKKPWAIY